MTTPLDHDPRVHPSIDSPTENGHVEDAGVDDDFVPLPPGLRDIRLSNQAATEIKNILDDASHPTYGGREMPTADASVLLEKIR